MTNPNLTHIEFILDRSGSMSSIKEDIEGGFNTFITDQQSQPGQCTVSLAQFDDVYEPVFTAIEIKDVHKLKLQPRGSTSLLDAVGRSITLLGERLAAMPEDERPHRVIVAIMTDGMENSSKEYTHAVIKQMIIQQEKVFSWEFLYMGADQDAIEVGASIGIRADRSLTYHRGRAQEAYAASSRLTSALRSAPAGMNVDGLGFEEQDRMATR
ncbi:MAG: VWA domain-containing protein [Propionibacteriaceae bacterium]|nr:VWA domain-containing protein [Propionibacteriaceae bacterium]